MVIFFKTDSFTVEIKQKTLPKQEDFYPNKKILFNHFLNKFRLVEILTNVLFHHSKTMILY